MEYMLKVIFRILLYCLILVIVRKVINVIQKPKDEITHGDSCEGYIDWKAFSTIYMIIGICFGIITILVVSFPANLTEQTEPIVVGCFGSAMLFFFGNEFYIWKNICKVWKRKNILA